jgi:hypothetical protein
VITAAPSRLRAFTLVLLATLPFGLTASAQSVDPGTALTIGASDNFTQSVSDCGGLNTCGIEANPAANTMGALTALSGIGSMRSARVTLINSFTVAGDNDRALGARLSGNVSWSGDLESFGAIGAAAFVTVGISIVDVSNGLTVGGQTLLDQECETFLLLDSCLRRISGSRAVNIPFQVQLGRSYEIRFTLECEANSGVGDANCVFNQNGAFPLAGGSVSRSDLTLNVEADIVGLLEEILEGVNGLENDVATLQGELGAHDERLADHEDAEADRFRVLKESSDRNLEATLESIRLLLTPQGRRDTDQPACEGSPCRFPRGRAVGRGAR